jgi:hypothetical protein
MRRSVVTLALLACAPALPGQHSGTRYTDPRSATVDASDARSIFVEARAGLLRIQGRSGISSVRVTGTAYASRREWLDDIQLVARREGDEVRIVADVPEARAPSWGDNSRGLDLIIEVPNTIRVEVEDGSGEAEVRGVAELDMTDGSGELEIADIGGPVHVTDGSGELQIRNVHGDVRIRDGSGEIRVRDVTGSLVVDDDGSGEINADGIRGSVRVVDDGSGSIHVGDVGGDFIVEHDGSGSISFDNVKGSVRVPRRRGDS